MPQWNRKTDELRHKYPDERWVATCAREVAAVLRRADHHVVWIAGRPALLLTYAWDEIPEAEWPEQLDCEVSFTYPKGHPKAPEAVQSIVASLPFKPRA